MRNLLGCVLFGIAMGAAVGILAGCNEDRRQNAADCQSGIRALHALAATDPAVKERADAIAKGAMAYAKAAAGGGDLPAPRMTPQQILAEPLEYEKAGSDALLAAQEEWTWGEIGMAALGCAMTLFGVGGVAVKGIGAVRLARKAKTALSIATRLVDRVANCETEEQVASAKAQAAAEQDAAGVRALTQAVRGKPT